MKELEIFDHIEAGRHQELYPEWAKTGTWSVRYKLARKGYELDILAHDEDEQIRAVAQMNHPEMVENYLESFPDMREMYRCILEMTYVDNRILDCQINYWDCSRDGITATLKTKKASQEEVASLLHATMSPAELYESGSHLWAKNLRVKEVDHVLLYVDCGMDFEEAYRRVTS
jgi:hypothetical protein